MWTNYCMGKPTIMDADYDIIFTKHDDGRLTVNTFPDQIMVSNVLLADIEAGDTDDGLRMDGDRLHISVANGSAVYVRSDRPCDLSAVWFSRLYGGLHGG